MRVRRDRTSCVTSLTILAFSLGERVVNHLARRCDKICVQSVSSELAGGSKAGWATRTHHFTLTGEQNQVLDRHCV
ncbi:hypothetical protein BDW42DRAFT_172673, partial [Aspergillus taichungensis]